MISLTPEELEALRSYEDQLNIVSAEIERAKTAGLDMTDLEARYTKVKALREGLLKVYGPQKERSRRVL